MRLHVVYTFLLNSSTFSKKSTIE